VELHYIAQDLDEHNWYVELAADFIEVVERFLSYVAAAEEEAEAV
jgi:hypothetical protein